MAEALQIARFLIGGDAAEAEPSLVNRRRDRIAVNLLHLQNVINTTYVDVESARSANLPFQDVLMVFVTAYCSGDSFAEFWTADDVLADYFIPYWLQLLEVANN